MKINEFNRINGVNRSYQAHNEYRKDGSLKSRAKDEVQISQQAQEMLNSSRLSGTERAAYIHQLKEAVQSGSYSVEAGKIAEKLLPFFK